jgi:hypothetical protein
VADSRARLTDAMDTMNTKYGLNTVYLGSIHNVRKEAPTRTQFGLRRFCQYVDTGTQLIL